MKSTLTPGIITLIVMFTVPVPAQSQSMQKGRQQIQNSIQFLDKKIDSIESEIKTYTVREMQEADSVQYKTKNLEKEIMQNRIQFLDKKIGALKEELDVYRTNLGSEAMSASAQNRSMDKDVQKLQNRIQFLNKKIGTIENPSY